MCESGQGPGAAAIALAVFAAAAGLTVDAKAAELSSKPQTFSKAETRTKAETLTRAETLSSALAQAYRNNPQLNAERARVRATDEIVPQALSGYRPTVTVTADVDVQYFRQESESGTVSGTTFPRGYGVTATQTLFNGLRTGNRTRAAEGQVFAGREGLRILEQQVLLDAATQYMNVLRDTAILELNRRNVEVLEEQLRQTRDRFNVGEVTRTDVAQAESRLAQGRYQVSLAESDLRASIARFRQVIGVEPRSLAPGRPIDRLVPRTLDAAVSVALDEHPAVKAALHAVDAAELQVKITEAELYPTLGVTGALTQRYDTQTAGDARFTASAVARLTVPIYEGGEVYA